nr:early nodulin 40 - kidney bean [Phaseolus vulgaris]
MERKECERVLTPHTPPLSTVCLRLALASLINKGCA